jgi:hypothetical protein
MRSESVAKLLANSAFSEDRDKAVADSSFLERFPGLANTLLDNVARAVEHLLRDPIDNLIDLVRLVEHDVKVHRSLLDTHAVHSSNT